MHHFDLARTRPLDDLALREGQDKQSGNVFFSRTAYHQMSDDKIRNRGYSLVSIRYAFASSGHRQRGRLSGRYRCWGGSLGSLTSLEAIKARLEYAVIRGPWAVASDHHDLPHSFFYHHQHFAYNCTFCKSFSFFACNLSNMQPPLFPRIADSITE
jgi:hypothetical protein